MTDYLGLPENASAHGAQIDALMAYVHWLMAVLLVGWGLFFIYTLIRFRRSRHAEADYHGVKSHASTYLEIGVAVVEGVLLIAFSIPIWAHKVNAFPPAGEATTVRIVAQQFAWNVHYPGGDGVFGRTAVKYVNEAVNPIGLDPTDAFGRDDITTVNQLHLPVNKPVIIHLSTKDVIHSLYLPQMRVKQDAIPGMDIPIWFTPTHPGQWEMACAQLCGLGHYRMRGYYTVHDQAGYDQWVAERLAEKAEDDAEPVDDADPVDDTEPAATEPPAGT